MVVVGLLDETLCDECMSGEWLNISVEMRNVFARTEDPCNR